MDHFLSSTCIRSHWGPEKWSLQNCLVWRFVVTYGDKSNPRILTILEFEQFWAPIIVKVTCGLLFITCIVVLGLNYEGGYSVRLGEVSLQNICQSEYDVFRQTLEKGVRTLMYKRPYPATKVNQFTWLEMLKSFLLRLICSRNRCTREGMYEQSNLDVVVLDSPL